MGCGTGPAASDPIRVISQVTPSAAGAPIAVATYNSFEFISFQGTGQIFTYSVSNGEQSLVASYSMPCADPSGMGVVSTSSVTALAVVCYDTQSLVTLRIAAAGTLSPLGTMTGLSTPFPGVAMDGKTMFIPLFGVSHLSNGAVAKVDLSNPVVPVLVKTTTLASPASGGFVNPGALTVGAGKVLVAAGSESKPYRPIEQRASAG